MYLCVVEIGIFLFIIIDVILTDFLHTIKREYIQVFFTKFAIASFQRTVTIVKFLLSQVFSNNMIFWF